MKNIYNILLAGSLALSLLSPVTSYASTEQVIEDPNDAVSTNSTQTDALLPLEILGTEIAPWCQFDGVLNLSMTCKGLREVFKTFEGPLPERVLVNAEQEKMTQLFSLFPKLRVLELMHTYRSFVDDNKLALLTNLTKFKYNSRHLPLTDVGLASLTALIELQLSLDPTAKISNNALSRLTNLTSLLLFNNITISGEALTTLTALKTLNLGTNTIITIQDLVRLPNLMDLTLYDEKQISGGDLTSLTSLRKLALYLGDSTIYAEVSRLTNLTELQLNGLYENPGPPFAPLSALRSLELISIVATDADFRQLQNLTKLQLFRNKGITGAGLRQLTALRKLRLVGEREMQDADILQLRNLDSLSVRSDTSITAASIAQLTNLTWLDLASPQYSTDDVLAPLINLPNLRVLYMSRDEDYPVESLTTLTNLTKLYIDEPFKDVYKGTFKKLFRALIDQNVRVICQGDTDWQDPS